MTNIIEKTVASVRNAEQALALSHVQGRNPLAKNARDCLIRQIWWGDRLLAALRDGEDYREASSQLEINSQAARRAMMLLRKESDRR